MVFGKRAGEFAARFAKENEAIEISAGSIEKIAAQSLVPFEHESSKAAQNPFEIQSNLQDMMQELVGIARVGNEMEEALTKIEALKERAKFAACGGNRGYNPGWHTAMELTHMLTVAEAIAKAAHERKESRGGHFREDFPNKSEEFGKVNVCIRKNENGKMEIKQIAKPKVREDLQQIIEEMK